MNKKTLSWMLMITLIVCASCSSTKKIIYLQDMPVDVPLRINNEDQTHIKSGDRLNIKVSSKNAELAAPFNGSSFSVNNSGDANVSGGLAEGGYLVDDNGDITFPILGKIHVIGMTMPDISEYIRLKLIDGKHMPDASVETTITNFTIYGLGALSPGKINVPEGQINLLQALAQFGDLQQAKIKRVRVIREFAGVRQEYDVDMTSKSLFDSPAFYLQQNDIVYAEPKKSSRQSVNATTTIISVAAVLASIAYSIAFILK